MNEFIYAGAIEEEPVEFGFADNIDSDSDNEDMDAYLKDQQKKEEKKRLDMTKAYMSAKADAEMSMMGPEMSRMDRTMQSVAPTEPTATDGDGETAQPADGEDGETAGDGEETAD